MLEPGARVDRYQVERVLGRGGMAVVYRARHVHLGTPAAIKVLTSGANGVRDRLLLEGRAQATLRHPNIVAVHDVIDVGGSPGLVMELVEGPSLAELLKQRRLTIDQADEIALGILDGVAAAHRLGVVHRDLKPGNVLLEVRADGLVPKVTDFGLAKALAVSAPLLEVPPDGLTDPQASMDPVGTPAYMAPEQLRDPASVDARADIFALGALLYELVTGRQAFSGRHAIEVYTYIHAGRYEPPERLITGLPERMAVAIRGALTVDRERRIPTVEALKEVWIGGEDAALAAAAQSGVHWADVVAEARRLLRNRPAGSAVPAAAPVSADDPTRLGPIGTFRRPPPEPGWVSPQAFSAVRVVLPAGVAFAILVGGGLAWWAARPDPQPGDRAGSGPDASLEGGPAPTGIAEGSTPGALPADGAGLGLADPAVGGAATGLPGGPPAGLTSSPDRASSAPVSLEAAPSGVSGSGPSPAGARREERPRTAPKEGEPARPTAAPTAAPPPEGAAPTAPAPTAMGALQVNSKPWSDEILVDGHGSIALKQRVDLPAGRHTLSLRAHDGRRVTREVEVPPGSTLVYCWDFDADKSCGR